MIRKILITFIPIFCFACNQQHKEGVTNGDNQSYKVDEYNVKLGKDLDQKEWECETLNGDVTCFPKKWHPIKQNSYHFFAYIDTVGKEEFYVIGKYFKDSLKITERDYLRKAYRELSLDTQEVLLSYDLKKLTLPRSHAYYAEYVTKKEEDRYIIYSMTFSYEGVLYDLTLKVAHSSKSKYKNIYQYILYNFQINGDYFFSKEKEILEFTQLSPSDL